jgi:endoglucanase
VVDNGNDSISHSEGQGYAMLLAVAAGDRPTFERLWQWTQDHLDLRDDRLFAWRWLPGASDPVPDRNNATDGDLLIAWALGRAAGRFAEPKYAKAAQCRAGAIRRQLRQDSRFGPLLLPGKAGFVSDKGVIINPSYLLFPAFRELAKWDPSPEWHAIEQSGRALLPRLVAHYRGLVPDWVSIVEGRFAPSEGLALRFGYDALRVPLYSYWGDAEELLDLGRIATVWQHDEAPAWLALDGPAQAEEPLSSAHLAVRRLIRNILAERRGDAPEPIGRLPQDYYGATLTLLAELAWRERHE